MFIRFNNNAEHLCRLQAFFVDKSQSDIQQLRESVLDNLVEFFPLVPTLETVHTADGHQTLQACVHGVCVIGTQQLNRDIQEPGPVFGEIILEDFLQKRNELGANIRGRRCQSRNQPFSKSWLLLLTDRCAQWVIFEGCPTPVDAVLQVNAGCDKIIHRLDSRHELRVIDKEKRKGAEGSSKIFGSPAGFGGSKKNRKKKKPTRKLNGVDLLRLQNIQKRIYKPRLRLGLKISQENFEISMASRKPLRTTTTYIFQIQFSLTSNIRIWVERRLYAVSEGGDVHFVPISGLQRQ